MNREDLELFYEKLNSIRKLLETGRWDRAKALLDAHIKYDIKSDSLKLRNDITAYQNKLKKIQKAWKLLEENHAVPGEELDEIYLMIENAQNILIKIIAKVK